MTKDTQKILLFGGTGSIGSSIRAEFLSHGWEVTSITRNNPSDSNKIKWDVLNENPKDTLLTLKAKGPFDAVCWAQGQNGSDSIYSFDETFHQNMYDANVIYILKSLRNLLSNALLNSSAKLCVISSIWQTIARQNKLSYGITKAAIQGLVLSLANDLAKDGHLINAVLPGVIDTPMTHENLTQAQIDNVKRSTQFNKLPKLEDVAHAVYFLCSKENTGTTGQFIKVDLGYSDVRIV
jgi:NAD(P)-dependent dehydrogenase (short-subunit alcohol dehydrogenase family)